MMQHLPYVILATFIIFVPEVKVGRVTAKYGPHNLAASESEKEPEVHSIQRVLLKDSNDDLFTERQLLNRASTPGSAALDMANPKSLDSNFTLPPVEKANFPDETQVVQPSEAAMEERLGVSKSEQPIEQAREAWRVEENKHTQQQDPILEEFADNQGQIKSTAEEEQLQRKLVESSKTPTWDESSDELSQQEQNVQIPGREGIQLPQPLKFPLNGKITNEEQFKENVTILVSKVKERQCSLALRQVSSMCRCSQVGKATWLARTQRETVLTSSLESLLSEISSDRDAVTRRRKHEADPLMMPHRAVLNSDSIFLRQTISRKMNRRVKTSVVENNTELETEEPIIVSLRLDCSCNGDQVLKLAGISALPPSVHQLHVSDCKGGEVALAPFLTASDSSLRHLTFTNIKKLTLGGGALDIDLKNDGEDTQFLMELGNIGHLRVNRGAIRLSGKNCNSSFVWKNVILESLPSFAITASNLVNFTLNGILIEGAVETASLNLESSGTYLALDEVDARKGIQSNWISGNLAGLSITRSRMNLAPGAFQQVSFSPGCPNVIIRNNIFGDQRWSSSVLHPSLASDVFDFFFKCDSALFNISMNTAECTKSNLEWLYEHKKSVILHWLWCGILKILSCHDNDQQPPNEQSCRFENVVPTVPEETTTSTAAIVKSPWQTPVTEMDKYRENQQHEEYSTENRHEGELLFLYPSNLYSTSNVYAPGSKYSSFVPNFTNSKRYLRDRIPIFNEQQLRDDHDDLHDHPEQTIAYQQKRNTGDLELDRPFRPRAEDDDFGTDLHRAVNNVGKQNSAMALERVSLPKESQRTSSGGSPGIVSSEVGVFKTALMVLHIYRMIIYK